MQPSVTRLTARSTQVAVGCFLWVWGHKEVSKCKVLEADTASSPEFSHHWKSRAEHFWKPEWQTDLLINALIILEATQFQRGGRDFSWCQQFRLVVSLVSLRRAVLQLSMLKQNHMWKTGASRQELIFIFLEINPYFVFIVLFCF